MMITMLMTFQCNSNIFSLLILLFSIRHGPGGVAWSFMYHIMIIYVDLHMYSAFDHYIMENPL